MELGGRLGKKGKGGEEVAVPARLWGGKGKKGGEKKMEWHWQKSLGKKEDLLFRSFSSKEKKVKLCVSVLQRHILNGKFAEENDGNIDATSGSKT